MRTYYNSQYRICQIIIFKINSILLIIHRRRHFFEDCFAKLFFAVEGTKQKNKTAQTVPFYKLDYSIKLRGLTPPLYSERYASAFSSVAFTLYEVITIFSLRAVFARLKRQIFL